MNALERVAARADAIGAAVARLRDRLGQGSVAEFDSAVRELGAALQGPLDDETRADLVHALVALASTAARRRLHRAARRLLLHVLALTVGDPHDWLYEPGAAAAFRAPDARAAAFVALGAALPTLEHLASAAEDVPPADATADADADADAVCSLDRAELAGLASTVRLLCSFAGPDARAALGPALRARLEADERAWTRACALVWGDGPAAAEAETTARDRAELPLVRAAAILRVAVDAIARGDTPRASVLALLVEVVTTPACRGWGEQWAPRALFAELGDRLEIALLSPAARLRFGASRPARVLHLTRALVAALDVIPDQWNARSALAGNLLGFALATRGAPWPQERTLDLLIPTLEELPALERELLETVARKVSPLEWDFDVHHVLSELGFPATYSGLRRWLGIDPPGLMNMPVEVQVDGAPRVLPLGLAMQRMLVGRVEASALARAMAHAFSPADLVAVTGEEFDAFDARLHCTGPASSDAEREAILDGLRLAALAARGREAIAPVLLERLDRWRSDALDALLLMLRALARMLEPGTVIPERFDRLIARLPHAMQIDPASVREVLGGLPEERRDRIFRASEEIPTFSGAREDYGDIASAEMRAQVGGRERPPPTKLHELMTTLLAAVEPLFPEP